LILRQGDTVHAEDIVFDDYPCSPGAAQSSHELFDRSVMRQTESFHAPRELSDSVHHAELSSILSALQTSSSRADAAKRLGISQRTLRHKLKTYRSEGLRVPDAYAR